MVGLKIYIPWWVCSCCERINHEHDKRTIFIVDVESLRRHYGKTLQHWARNFENVLEEVRKTKDERFIRMWRLYLNACAASFFTGNIDLHQFVFTKGINDTIPMTRSYMYE